MQLVLNPTNWRVKHEAVDSVARGENDHGGTSVQGVTGGHDLTTWERSFLSVGSWIFCRERNTYWRKRDGFFWSRPSCIFLPDWRPSPGAKGPSWGFLARHRNMKSYQWLLLKNILEDGEDGSNGYQAINVGTSIQGVKRDNILPLPLGFHLDFILVFLKVKVIIVL